MSSNQISFGDYEPVIGLEIHAQLLTKSKIFSSDSAEYGGADNEHTSPTSVGMPGALPVLNKRAVEFGVKIGLALNCDIRRESIFSRKQYFYPDSPKGYQISQFDKPLCEKGFVEFLLDGEPRKIAITRAHMEEDAGKSIHQGEFTLINLNRCGVPLLEIVSEPEIRSAAEAAEFARTVRQILIYLGVNDGNLEEGSFRCDCNVSVRKKGATKFGTRVELKNINSFRFVEKAIDYEIQRQIDAIDAGEIIRQETRLYDADKNRTFTMRSKEEAHDYRYFPDPDLLPLVLHESYIDAIQKQMPELPLARAKRFQTDHGLPVYDSLAVTAEKPLADYYEQVVAASKNAKASANWITTELLRELNDIKKDVTQSPVSAQNLGQMIIEIDKGTISGKIAKTVFAEMWASGKDPQTIIKEQGLVQISDTGAIEKMIDDVIAANPGQLEQFRSGKEKLFGFFVGQVMKASKGQANPDLVNDLLKTKLKG